MVDQSNPMEEVELLKSLMWKKSFFLMTRTINDPTKLAPVALLHYQWIIGLEKQGKVFASGPLFSPDGKQGAGMTVFRVASFEEAEKHAEEDPFVSSGAVTYDLQKWQINEGRLNITVDFSDMSGDAI